MCPIYRGTTVAKVLVVGAVRPNLVVVTARPGLLVRMTTTSATFAHVVIAWILHSS